MSGSKQRGGCGGALLLGITTWKNFETVYAKPCNLIYFLAGKCFYNAVHDAFLHTETIGTAFSLGTFIYHQQRLSNDLQISEAENLLFPVICRL